ncbi:MAG: triose-phosphate isomerase [Candidatus Magasanikbacteria bacterium CG10_big_fil_rev_8_21_14_0_10_42_10]|uniref:Triosephosphate isomerase n=2 Tax=Candidatus Magasanikiibacteriota TaxID=1752731 RepID=A0A2H0TW04_9BACT|nr:MAG: triose-phosphate isomerase [Candidatus Magasanikbacteria bacterium CG10_big_fil_rev_8_21_14_0_10_42_10]PIZ93465.1 MAG: triose-phosphate isomerase [Candidatus Magasanikbacteria bacterium CG_4_10_14_0_2_um_filter_41_10]
MTYLFANWKMYLNFSESMILANQLAEVSSHTEKIQLGLFPSTLAFTEVEKLYRGSSVFVGAQNVAWTPKGAYTGAVSALMFREAGATHALVGHSERRHIFGETNEDVKKKFDACLDAGIIPILCIGETKEDLDAGKREYRLKKQLMSVLDGISKDVEFFVAYEPVWAIGTGDACDHLQAAEIHDFIKDELNTYSVRTIPVLYGGSVNHENVVSYLPHESIDGFLVGSASAEYEHVHSLLNAVLSA